MSATSSGGVRTGAVDTSAPFESVKEAVHRLEATWRPQPPPIRLRTEEIDMMKVEEQTVKLEMDLFVQERETLQVLKELELTKRIADDLKLQLQKTTAESSYSSMMKVHPIQNTEEERPPANSSKHFGVFPRNSGGKQSPGKTLMDLEQAKANLSRTTSGLSGIRTTIESLKMKLEIEKSSLAKTNERLHLNRAAAASLEQMLGRYVAELRLKSGLKTISTRSASEVWARIRQLNSEKENYIRTTENYRSDICNLTAEIEQMKSRIKTVKVRLILAEKMKEASKVAEAVALKEIRSLRENHPSQVTLAVKDYAALTLKAREADEISKKIIDAATLDVERAKQSKIELVEKVEEVEFEVSTGRKALEEALKREAAANEAKLEAEEALRRLHFELSQQRRSVHNSTKFKNSSGTQRRGSSQILDVNGLSLATSGSRSLLGSTLSIGQILRKKLMGPEEHRVRMSGKGNSKPRVSLAQILAQKHELYSPLRIDDGRARKQHFFAKRRKFSFAGLALLLAKQKRRKKKQELNS